MYAIDLINYQFILAGEDKQNAFFTVGTKTQESLR